VIDVVCKRCPFSVLKLVKPCSRCHAVVAILIDGKVHFGYVIVAEVLVALVLVCLVYLETQFTPSLAAFVSTI
jgi:hypothetical protein